TMFDIAGGIFKSVNPDVLMTTNSFGYPADDVTEQDYFEFYDAVADSLDVIALDLYPESQDDIDHLPDRITNAETRYNKPVIVAEIGRHGMIDAGGDASRTIEGQRLNVVKYMDALRPTDAMAVILYELRDNGPDDDDFESNFGIMEYNGDHKASFDDIMYSMRPNQADPGDNSGGDNTGGDAGGDNTGGSSGNGDTGGGGGSGNDGIVPKVPNTGTAH
ncbi:MAG: arabinogalactan endo-1,4-beta-galactosidase, partial [bacterium]|nr:arabinogalactan endo-1,4-beta-galactosidase [bacterium]